VFFCFAHNPVFFSVHIKEIICILGMNLDGQKKVGASNFLKEVKEIFMVEKIDKSQQI